MKKLGIADDGAGNANENGETRVVGVVLGGPLCELTAGAGGSPPVGSARCRRLAGCTRQFDRTGWRRRTRPRPVLRRECGRHFAFERAGMWRGGGVTVVVVMVVVGVWFGSAPTSPAPSMSAAHHASVDMNTTQRAQAQRFARRLSIVTLGSASRLIVTPRTRSSPHLCPLGQPLDLIVLLA